MNKQPKHQPKSPKTTYMFLGIGLGLLALGGFGYWYFKGRKGGKVEPNTDLFHQLSKGATDPAADIPGTKPSSPAEDHSGFPLKRGSRGALVKQLQTALNQTYGEAVFATEDIVGIFGPKTEATLVAKGFPKAVDLATFTKIITPPVAPTGGKAQVPANSASTSPDAAINNPAPELTTSQAVEIANNLQRYAAGKDLAAVLNELKRLRTVGDYNNVNTVFKNIRLGNVHQTLVTGLLSVFSDAGVKPLVTAEFKRIGLKQSGNGTWSLSGPGSPRRIITRQATTIRADNGFSLEVPQETMLGVEIGRVRQYSRFRTLDNNILYVPLNHIRYV